MRKAYYIWNIITVLIAIIMIISCNHPLIDEYPLITSFKYIVLYAPAYSIILSSILGQMIRKKTAPFHIIISSIIYVLVMIVLLPINYILDRVIIACLCIPLAITHYTISIFLKHRAENK